MKELSFNTGLETYRIKGANGETELSFNPTDMAFIERLYDAVELLDSQQETYREETKKKEGNKELFRALRAIDQEMRRTIDEAMKAPVCDKIFGEMNMYALGDGLPVWLNFILMLLDETDAAFGREKNRTNPRIAKYTEKYGKRR